MGAHAAALPHCARQPRFLRGSPVRAPTCARDRPRSAVQTDSWPGPQRRPLAPPPSNPSFRHKASPAPHPSPNTTAVQFVHSRSSFSTLDLAGNVTVAFRISRQSLFLGTWFSLRQMLTH
ncbi:hypothetical protein PUN28_018843 [Cardiocondyla obscurior]|uniref:Uncharacterized protein n=1 Tax=Cardiocondyla obscurior TaxID=286306 RepID=A0AAW2EHS1_9HYME